jgi:UDP:flavonoid glycosyltransferase YjiC (YdhE family)
MTSTRARVLFVTPPGYGHLFPMIPLAWALRSAGHDVLIATCGTSVNAVARAGLAAVDVAPGVDVPALLQRHKEGFARAYPPGAGGPDGSAPDSNGSVEDTTTSVFTELSDVMADDVVQTARRWRADLIVYAPEAAAALIASARCAIPAVFLSIGLGHTPTLMATRYKALRPACERHDLQTLPAPAAWLDLSPPSLRDAPSDGWPMRYLQYNGGYTWSPPESASALAPQPCVAVTLGTMTPLVCGLTPLRGVIEAARHVDAMFLVAHGSSNARELGPLPPNVRASSWIGLDVLIASCSAGIHHGGFGTSLAMLAAGWPQLLLPQGADQFHNANTLAQRGVAEVPADGVVDVELLRRWLQDEMRRAAAEDVAAEIARMPSPVDIVPRLIGLLH